MGWKVSWDKNYLNQRIGSVHFTVLAAHLGPQPTGHAGLARCDRDRQSAINASQSSSMEQNTTSDSEPPENPNSFSFSLSRFLQCNARERERERERERDQGEQHRLAGEAAAVRQLCGDLDCIVSPSRIDGACMGSSSMHGCRCARVRQH
jgi:hypothetical protein